LELLSAEVGGRDLTQLMYRSRSLLRGPRAGITADVGKILETSRRKNRLYGVTGVLFFDGFHFVQTLEGPAKAIATLYEQISGDSRHENIVLLNHAAVGGRCFADWAMAFVGRGDDLAFRIPSGFLSELVAGDDGVAGNLLEVMTFFLHEK
jgi:hypothetical protein